MQRRKPLERHTPLRNGTSLKRKPKAKSDTERRLAALWFEWVTRGKRCAVCGAQDGDLLPGDMHGLRVKIEGHHVIEREALRTAARARGLLPEILIWDARIGMPICAYPCHALHTNRVRVVPREKVPEAAVEFAAEYGLESLLERIYGRLAA